MAMIMVLSLAACGGSSSSGGETKDAPEAATSAVEAAAGNAEAGDQSLAGKKVGLAMPTQSSERWINDGNNMKSQLEAKGAEVVLQFGDDDIQQQVSQIEGMIAQQVDCLVIAAIDSGSLTTVEQAAADAGIPIIAYDRLLMDRLRQETALRGPRSTGEDR